MQPRSCARQRPRRHLTPEAAIGALLAILSGTPALAQEAPLAHTCEPREVDEGRRRPCELVEVVALHETVRCEHRGDLVRCTTRLDARLRSRAPVALPLHALTEEDSAALEIDGASPREATIMLEPSRERAIRLSRTHDAELREPPFGFFDEVASFAPLRIRHPVFTDMRQLARTAQPVVGLTRWTAPRFGWASVAPPAREVELIGPIAMSGDEVRERASGSPIANGGPVIAAGYTFDRGARILAGYELGLREGWTSLIMALSADVVVDDLVEGTIALTLEAATPSVWFVLPSFSIGLGPAIGITEHAARFLLRGLAQITWPLGLTFLVDVDPAAALVDVSILGRVSL